MHGNRETSRAPSPDGGAGRSEKAMRRTADTHAFEESDDLIVPQKQANKAGGTAAEPVEGSGSAKGNAQEDTASRTQSRHQVSLGLEGVRQVARRDKDVRFTALLHHVNPEQLQASYFQLRKQASPGVDGETWAAYGEDLETRIPDLHGRIHRGAYRPKPSKRQRIPKADGRERLLGIAAVEDKIVQHAVKTVLEAIYEADFMGFSYGFRPGRSQHRALDAVWVGMTKRKVNWVLDADIRGYFDTIDHGWMLKFLEHRIADRRIIRLIERWLEAGVVEDGIWSETEVGTPQGSVISPLLSNVYLHYVFDLWADQWRRKYANGDVVVVRYADDFVMGFQHEAEARRFHHELKGRFAKFGLALHPQKTRVIEFGRYAAERRSKRGQPKPETFDFLGFTHQCGVSSRGWFEIKRRSIAKRMRAKLHDLKEQLRRRMHMPLIDQAKWLRSVVQGWFQYHAVPGNGQSLDQFQTQVGRLWLRMLRRRSQKGRKWTWKRMTRLIRTWFPKVRILHPYPTQRLIVTT